MPRRVRSIAFAITTINLSTADGQTEARRRRAMTRTRVGFDIAEFTVHVRAEDGHDIAPKGVPVQARAVTGSPQ